jgi:hypothetical protein
MQLPVKPFLQEGGYKRLGFFTAQPLYSPRLRRIREGWALEMTDGSLLFPFLLCRTAAPLLGKPNADDVRISWTDADMARGTWKG